MALVIKRDEDGRIVTMIEGTVRVPPSVGGLGHEQGREMTKDMLKKAWYNRSDSARRGEGKTSPQDFSATWLGPTGFDQWLGSLEAHCTESLKSSDATEKRYAQDVLDLIRQVRRALEDNDAQAAAEIGVRLGRIAEEWGIKDLVGPDVEAGIKGLKAHQLGGRQGTVQRTKNHDLRMADEREEWVRLYKQYAVSHSQSRGAELIRDRRVKVVPDDMKRWVTKRAIEDYLRKYREQERARR